MATDCAYTDYASTGSFSKIVVDYLNEDEKLLPFYRHPVSLEGIKEAIKTRQQADTPRQLLVDELRKQYAGIPLTQKQEQNLQLLLQQNAFTVCTAHQPVIFLGPLYFIYKIVHAIKLADELNNALPANKFVPVFYMGSEDADLDELGHIYLNGEKLRWETNQTGAVGRMKVDKPLLQLIERLAGQLNVHEHGRELTGLFRAAYQEGTTIQQATLQLVNALFADFGLLVLIPDNAELKRSFLPVMKRELTEQFSHQLVANTSAQLNEHYKVQATGREINLFYLADTSRERIMENGEWRMENGEKQFLVKGEKKQWTEAELLHEAETHPERFSPNVILRGALQETILPNVAFIGGGGEIAYWLQLKAVFDACNIPFPVLVLRNSFMMITEAQKKLADKLGFTPTDLFKPTEELVATLVTKNSSNKTELSKEKEELKQLYEQMATQAAQNASSLAAHVAALQKQAINKLDALEKKMFRAEKKKFEAEQRQINKLKQQLFPNNGLQERIENFSSFYARYGKEWLVKVYECSLSLEQQFAIIDLP